MVNAVSFGKRDNENNPTGGKWIGAGLGAAWSGYSVYKTNKYLKQVDDFVASDSGKKIYECKNIDAIKDVINKSNINAKFKKAQLASIKVLQMFIKDEAEVTKAFKASLIDRRGKTPILIAGFIFKVLIGLGLGAIVDHFRKKDEDD